MKKFNEMSYTERKEIGKMFAAWLGTYTHEVVIRVMEKRDEILANEFAMKMIKELATRQEMEKERLTDKFVDLFDDFETFKEYNVHNNCLEHSSSYRDVLYDMYIR